MFADNLVTQGYDYTACIDYMDPDVCCHKKAVKLNHSLIYWWHKEPGHLQKQ